MPDYLKEKSTGYLDAAFKDKDGNPVAPASARYRIDCLTNGVEILGWTVINAPQAVHELVLTAAQNVLINPANRAERRLVTVEATDGAGETSNAEYEYSLRNMKGVA